jgi:hypothetical protein
MEHQKLWIRWRRIIILFWLNLDSDSEDAHQSFFVCLNYFGLGLESYLMQLFLASNKNLTNLQANVFCVRHLNKATTTISHIDGTMINIHGGAESTSKRLCVPKIKVKIVHIGG